MEWVKREELGRGCVPSIHSAGNPGGTSLSGAASLPVWHLLGAHGREDTSNHEIMGASAGSTLKLQHLTIRG